MRKVGLALLLIYVSCINIQAIDVDEILKKVDEKYDIDTQLIESTMTISSRRGKRELSMLTYTYKTEKSYSEYLAPAREKGTKMLRLEDSLWTYNPMADRIIKISGHLLRQSVMGSDFSYEDMLERDILATKYDAVLLNNEMFLERPCYVIELIAKSDDLAYPKRHVWVDQERYIALKEERFAKSGVLLKKTEVTEVMEIDKLWYPKKMLFKDMLKKGQGTIYEITSLKIDVDVPEYVFTKAVLR